MSEELNQFVQRHVAQQGPLERERNLAYWSFSTSGREEHAVEMARLEKEWRLLHADAEGFQKLKSLSQPGPEDALLARQAKLLRDTFQANQMDEAAIRSIVDHETSLENLFTNFRAELGGEKVSDNRIREILRQEWDLALRRAAWEASKQIGAQAAPLLLELVALRNQAARQMGFPNYYTLRLTLSELDEQDLFRTFDRLEELTDPLWKRYKESLDGELAERFGIRPAELRPWHYSDPFFQEAPATEVDLDPLFAEKDPVALARAFYTSIGFDIAEILFRSDLYEREGKLQHAYCIRVDREQDIRVLCNLKPTEHWMSTLLHEMGHAVYYQHIDPSLPYLLRETAHTLSTEAIAILMGRHTTDPHWLVHYAGMAPQEAQALSRPLDKSLAAEGLIFSRWVLVMSHFEQALYRDPQQDLDRLWWDLVERYQWIRPPEGRKTPDWAAKIHLSSAPVYYHNYLLGWLVGSQLRHFILGQVLGNGVQAPERAVWRPEVGEYLRTRYFRLGARVAWNETLEEASGERLRPDYFVEELHRGLAL